MLQIWNTTVRSPAIVTIALFPISLTNGPGQKKGEGHPKRTAELRRGVVYPIDPGADSPLTLLGALAGTCWVYSIRYLGCGFCPTCPETAGVGCVSCVVAPSSGGAHDP
jgi:hypothetical protein